jgi:hypothetical protein
MNANTKKASTTLYFGLPVEVVHRMKTCSLIRFSGQDTIVDTDDLTPLERIQPGSLTGPLSQSCPEPDLFLHAMVATAQ